MLTIRFWVLAMLSSVAVHIGADLTYGQEYPTKPVRMVTGSPGGAADFSARMVAQGLSSGLGQPVVVDNRAARVLGEVVAKAPPDGYTLLIIGTGFWLAPFLQDMSYDPVRDFSPIALVNRAPNILVVHPSLPIKSVKDLIALAKARPTELNYAAVAPGSPAHLSGELFNALAGVKMTAIQYKGAGQAITELIGGQVQLTFISAGSVVPHIKAGKLRAVAVTSAQPSTLFPTWPTIAATLPGYEVENLTGIFAPARTPDVIIRRLNQEVGRAVTASAIRDKFLASGIEVVNSSPEQFAATMKSDMARMGKVIKDAGIKAE